MQVNPSIVVKVGGLGSSMSSLPTKQIQASLGDETLSQNKVVTTVNCSMHRGLCEWNGVGVAEAIGTFLYWIVWVRFTTVRYISQKFYVV